MKIKKVIVLLLVAVLTGGAAAGGIYSYKSYQDKSRVVEVQPVSSLNWGYYGDSETSYGMVTNDSAQEIYLDGNSRVESVFVEEGDTVKEGDPLLQYDTDEVQIEIKRKRLDISTIENNIAIAAHMLDVLRQTKPVDKERPEIDMSSFSEKRKKELEAAIEKMENLPEKDEKDNRIFNYVTEDSIPYNADTADGTEQNPYIYYCNKDVYAYGSFFNSIRAERNGTPGKYVRFIICKKDSDGRMVMEEVPEEPGTSELPDPWGTQEPGTGETQPETQEPGTSELPDPWETQEPGTSETQSSSETQEPGTSESPVPGDTQQPADTQQPGDTQRPEQGGNTELSGEQAADNRSLSAETMIVSNPVRFSRYMLDDNNAKVPVPDGSIVPNEIVFNGNNFPTVYDDDRMWYVFTGEEVGDTLQDLLDQIEEEQDWEEPDGYSEKELAEAIDEKQEELKKLDLELRQEKLKLESLESAASDGVVYAKLDGVVKSVGDPDDEDGSGAFLVLTGDDGLYVSGTISELLLDTVKPGTVVTANSWESGNTFQATVTEISDYPVSGNSWGDGNQNVSYYQYTAFIEDSSALKNGEYVDLSIATNQTESDSEAIYIEKAYVRQENGRSYCMIADENDRLKKQYVVTGKTVYGSAVEIKSGLTESDRIAFPYGKNAVEGAAVTDDAGLQMLN